MALTFVRGDRVLALPPSIWQGNRGSVVQVIGHLTSANDVGVKLDVEGMTDLVWFHKAQLRLLNVVERVGELEAPGEAAE